MMSAFRPIRTALVAYWRDLSGVTAIIMVLATSLFLIVFGGMVIDLGHAFTVQRQLQAQTDASALAGASAITSGTAVATATTYSAVAGNKNALGGGVTVSFVSGSPTLKCFGTTGYTCVVYGSQIAANGIQVKEQAVVPTYFLRVVGINSITVHAIANAGERGGKGSPLDVEIIIDSTHSMNDSDTSCSVKNGTRLSCAQAGARALLQQFSTTYDQVGLMTFPGAQSGTQQNDYNCSGSAPTIVAYNNSPTYNVAPLATNYLSSGALNASSNLVRALGGGGSTCATGLQAIGGYGTFYADAITAAQNLLTTNGRANAQKVIIFLSDGDANASSSDVTSGKANNQCHEGITAANAATAAGTIVLTVAYGSPTGNTPSSCSTDTGSGMAISACTTMSDMASAPKYFFSDAQGVSGGCQSSVSANNISDLVTLLGGLASVLGGSRLVPDDAT